MKQIKRNRETGDFDMFLSGRYVGSRQTYMEAERDLDQIVFETLKRGTV